jgi:1-acyl-sn-glycerol-3-phosphate acyltransferase
MADASDPSTPAPRAAASSGAPRGRHRFLGNAVARTVLSIWAWFVLGLVIIIWTPLVFLVWLVTLPFDRGHYAAGYLFRKLCVAHQILNPLWTFRTTGTNITDPRRPYVVVANHQSFVDILLISHLPWEMKWLSKQHFFRFPLVGWMMRMAGDIRLVRGERDSVVQAMAACKDRLEKKTSVMIFPEGTRSRDGELKAFKDGAFRLAIENQVPILPLAVNGAYDAMVKGDWRFGVSDAEVRVLEPIMTEGLTLADLPSLRDRTHQVIADAVHDMRGLPRTNESA